MRAIRLQILGSLSIMVLCSSTIGGVVRVARTSVAPEKIDSGKPAPKESIREQLTHLRERTGLALVTSIGNKMYEVDFKARALREVGSFYSGRAAALGVISNRGNRIAFVLDMTPGNTQPSPVRPACPGRTCLAVADVDGANLGLYPNVIYPGGMCWSHDDSALVMAAQDATRSGNSREGLQLMKLDSRLLTEIDSFETFATSQCWSPDDGEVVYTVNKPVGIQTIRVYDTRSEQTHELGSGGRATWSPDGKGIAVLHCPPSLRDCTYELVNPSSGERKPMFTTALGQTPLWWSPDSRFVAYVSPIAPAEDRANTAADQVYRLRVRRLDDNSEEWVLNLRDTDALEFQWITNRAIKQP